jgi:hypothetical protein
MRGWWGYYRLAENRRPIYRLEPWIRRHIRKCFWLRWHAPDGRERRLRSLGFGEDRQPAKRALERGFTPPWLSHPIGSSGLLTRGFQPPDAENRTSGVWEGAGAQIPVTRPNRDWHGYYFMTDTDCHETVQRILGPSVDSILRAARKLSRNGRCGKRQPALRDVWFS